MSLTQIKISQVPNVIEHIPADHAIMFRGPHGIGKSSLVRQCNRKLIEATGRMRPLVDRRLSQMQGGDIMGLPDISNRSTRWNHPDWYKMACDQACDLLLDELNRAEVDVMNSFFQIALDRELNGLKLHPETRVYTGINLSSQYNVNQVDPALLDRFWVGDLTTSVSEWSTWARAEGLHPDYISWLEQNELHFMVVGDYNVNDVLPSPRSHERAAKTIHRLLDAEHLDAVLLRQLTSGYIGAEASISLVTHLQAEFRFDGMDVLNSYRELKARGKFKMDRIDVQSSCIEKAIDALVQHKALGQLADNARVTKKPADAKIQGANLEAMLTDVNPELRPTVFQKIAKLGDDKLDLIRSMHTYVMRPILKGLNVPAGEDGVGIYPNMAGLDHMIEQASKPVAAE
jgi:MoxR-like ATPase